MLNGGYFHSIRSESLSRTLFLNIMERYDEMKFVCLLERPTVPLYLGPRGHGSTKYLYNLPADYLDQYQVEAMIELRKMIPSSTTIIEVPVYRTKVPYDLSPIQKAVSKDAIFSGMNRRHLEAATELTKILLGQSSSEDFFNACALCRDSVNTHLWIHAFTRAVLLNPEMKGFRLPAVWEIMPDMFVEARVWRRAIAEATLPQSDRAIIVIDKDFTGLNLNPEHKVAYFSEDIGANSHHWHWHIVNPFNLPKGTGDRKGEMFYYMHHNMLARYDAERLANGLNRVVPFDIHRDMIEEACFAKLSIQNSAYTFSDRQEKSILRDFDRSRDPNSSFLGFQTISNIRAWIDRIIEAIDAGFAILEGGGRVDLRTERGIDIVACMWESNFDSPNLNYYGMPHNYGMPLDSFMIQTFDTKQAPPGVMYLTGTAMRDPVFFRWHRYLDLISQRQKDYLKPYTLENLTWSGIIVNNVEVIRMEPSQVPMPALDTKNTMVTHWMQSDVEVSRGLDFGRTNINGLGSIWVRVTHLQHVPFVYRIRVTNQNRASMKATVRIFMAPKLDENGDKLPFYAQRVLFFEMDKFTTTLHPGENIIVQKSEDSTLTIPWEQTFRDIEREARPTRAQSICGCGWPDYLLLPRGKKEGMPFDLFAMLTNAQLDQVPGAGRPVGTLNAKGACRDSVSFCGLIDDKFPDAKPMGYPFDRPAVPDERLNNEMFLSDFVKPILNMGTADVTILHVDKTVLRGNGASFGTREVKVAP